MWVDAASEGVSCTAACQADGGKECDGAAFVDVTNEAKFDEASSMACEGGYGLSNSVGAPYKSSNTNKCYYATTGTCGAFYSSYTRA